MPDKTLIPGQTFGDLTVLHSNNKKGWQCRCSCGKEINTPACELRSGRRRFCNAYKHGHNIKRLPDDMGTKNALYRGYRASAKRRGYEFELSFEEFTSLINKNCHFCGSEPTSRYKYGHYRETKEINLYNGIDRYDNTKGYTVENSVTCCSICNRAKSTIPPQDFIEWIKIAYKYNYKKQHSRQKSRVLSV